MITPHTAKSFELASAELAESYSEALVPVLTARYKRESEHWKAANPPLSEILDTLRTCSDDVLIGKIAPFWEDDVLIGKIAPFWEDDECEEGTWDLPALSDLIALTDESAALRLLVAEADRKRGETEIEKLGKWLGATDKQIALAIQRKIRLVSEFQQLIKNEIQS